MKGIDPFSHFTFTLTSLLRPTEHLLLIRERFFPFIWLPDILLEYKMSRMGVTVVQQKMSLDI